jgi:hypothetical protein
VSALHFGFWPGTRKVPVFCSVIEWWIAPPQILLHAQKGSTNKLFAAQKMEGALVHIFS